jgi:hypothetical protein
MGAFRFWLRRLAGSLRSEQGRKKTRQVRRRPRLESLEDRTLLSANPIVIENQLQGAPQSQWDVSGAGDLTIQGYTTDISVNQGGTVSFKIDDQARVPYHLDIYRMGYYGGMGARLVTSIPATQTLDVAQPSPLTDPTTGMIDAGNWSVTATWTVPTTATSGIYFAKVIRNDTGGASHIVFVVRSDSSHSDMLVKTDDATWEAYNPYGGGSLYDGNPDVRTFAVSYNRPFQDRATQGGFGTTNWVFYAEYPMVRFLERNGYDVSYFTDVDTSRSGSLILQHKIFMSVGHDEYWSGPERASVEAARNAGVNLAFFSGNISFWKTRWANSIDASHTSYRSMVCYKETLPNTPTDPADPPTWTGTWRDPTHSPPADGGRPENAFIGTLFMVNRGPGGESGTPMTVPAFYAPFRFWRNTSVATLGPGQQATLGLYVLGYEWDMDVDNGFRPGGLIDLSATTQNVPELMQDYGATYAPGVATHNLTLYRASSGALVFSAGTVQWAFGLDANHDGPAGPTDSDMQQATVNLFADMGVQPQTLMSGLVPATASTDTTPPTSTITGIANGFTTVQTRSTYTITGTATDPDSVVAVVEVSVDGGATWHRASGTNHWTYTWVPTTVGTAQILSRAVDDSVNMEKPSDLTKITVLDTTVTPPQVANLQVVFSNPQTAAITWLTDENSTSRVDYGTTPTALTQSVTSSTLVTNHSLTLTNLVPNTVYYYRITSIDPYNNSTTVPSASGAPASFTAPGFVDSPSDGGFNAATALVNTNVLSSGIGLSSAVNYQFTGTTLPPAFTVSANLPGGSATVGGGALTIDGAKVGTSAVFGFGSSVDFVATFSGDANQHAGFAVDLNNAPWAIFSTGGGGALYARVNNAFSTTLSSSYLGSAHDFRIDWTATAFNFYVDGVQVASDAISIGTYMRPMFSDYTPGGGVLRVTSMSLTQLDPLDDSVAQIPHATPGSITSRVFDGGTAVYWGAIAWADALPAQTSLAFSVRMGNTATPDGSWTSWIPVSGPGAAVGGVSRYLQYQANLATSDPLQTPILEDVTLIFGPASSDHDGPTVASRTPSPAATNVNPGLPISVGFSEFMDPTSITSSTVRLRASGASSDLAATLTYSGSTAVLTPNVPLTPNTTYQVTVSGSVKDVSGNAMGSDVTWTFTAGWLTFTQSTAADFGNGTTGSQTSVLPSGVALASGISTNFPGTSLPSGWFVTTYASGGSAVVNNGVLTVDGARAGTTAQFGSGSSLTFVATYSGDPYQHGGFGVAYDNVPWAIFSTGGGNALYARTGNISTQLSSSYLNAAHTFRIDWSATAVNYYIDGVQVASHNVAVSGTMRPLFSDFSPGGGTLKVNSMSLVPLNPADNSTSQIPYVSSGTYTSQIFDAGGGVFWNAVSWANALPAGTSVAIGVRMGNTVTPDGSWTGWVPLSSSGAVVGGVSRYLQYQANLATSASLQTPFLQTISMQYSAAVPDRVAPFILAGAPVSGATEVSRSSPITIGFSEQMNPATFSTGTIHLRAVGGSADVPTTVTFSGATAVLTPTSALDPVTKYQVTVSGSVTDVSGNALGADATWTFTTTGYHWQQSTAADFNAGTMNGVTLASGGGIQLAPFFDDFPGTALASSWTVSQNSSSGSATVANSVLTVSAANVFSQVIGVAPVEGKVSFGASPYQHFGLATGLDSFSGNAWAIFSTAGTTNTLYARVNVFGVAQDVGLGALPAGYHDYLVQPVASGFQFWVDGVLQTTISIAAASGTNFKAVLSDLNGTAGAILQADWVRFNATFVSSGTFLSSIFDAGRAANWMVATFNTSVPANTTLTVYTRSGNTPTPDGTWSAWAAVSSGGTVTSPSARYLQYEVVLTTTDSSRSPVLYNIDIEWS